MKDISVMYWNPATEKNEEKSLSFPREIDKKYKDDVIRLLVNILAFFAGDSKHLFFLYEKDEISENILLYSLLLMPKKITSGSRVVISQNELTVVDIKSSDQYKKKCVWLLPDALSQTQLTGLMGHTIVKTKKEALSETENIRKQYPLLYQYAERIVHFFEEEEFEISDIGSLNKYLNMLVIEGNLSKHLEVKLDIILLLYKSEQRNSQHLFFQKVIEIIEAQTIFFEFNDFTILNHINYFSDNDRSCFLKIILNSNIKETSRLITEFRSYLVDLYINSGFHDKAKIGGIDQWRFPFNPERSELFELYRLCDDIISEENFVKILVMRENELSTRKGGEFLKRLQDKKLYKEKFKSVLEKLNDNVEREGIDCNIECINMLSSSRMNKHLFFGSFLMKKNSWYIEWRNHPKFPAKRLLDISWQWFCFAVNLKSRSTLQLEAWDKFIYDFSTQKEKNHFEVNRMSPSPTPLTKLEKFPWIPMFEDVQIESIKNKLNNSSLYDYLSACFIDTFDDFMQQFFKDKKASFFTVNVRCIHSGIVDLLCLNANELEALVEIENKKNNAKNSQKSVDPSFCLTNYEISEDVTNNGKLIYRYNIIESIYEYDVANNPRMNNLYGCVSHIVNSIIKKEYYCSIKDELAIRNSIHIASRKFSKKAGDGLSNKELDKIFWEHNKEVISLKLEKSKLSRPKRW